jgi:hypothetical protein
MNFGEPNVERLEHRVAIRKKINAVPGSELLIFLFKDTYQKIEEHEEASVRFLEFYNNHRDEQGNFKPNVSDCAEGIFDYGVYLLKRRMKG